MEYRREIDGLRAIAVVPVILFHAGFEVFSGGFVGVDVFFVISGFLITSILIDELEQDDFSIARFYERRARRILPALFVVLLVCIPFAWMWMLPSELKRFFHTLITVVLFVSNIRLSQQTGYFEPAAELNPLLHTWSLAVEEQYYLLFPVFLLVLWRFGRNRVLWLVVATAAVSLLLSEYGWRTDPSANFFLAPTRAWELLAGSICAFLTVGKAQKSSNVLSAIGIALVLFSIFYYDSSIPFPSVYALAPVIGTALILLHGREGTLVARVLSMAPLVSIGLISYSAYLWHQPLFAFARIRSITEPSQGLMAGLSLASLLLSFLTWKYVEQPCRQRSGSLLRTRNRVFAVGLVVSSVLIAVGAVGRSAGGFENRLPPEVLTIAKAARDKFPSPCLFSEKKSPPKHPQSVCLHTNTKNKIDVLLLGDSHSTTVSHEIGKALRNLDIGYYDVAYATCLPFAGFRRLNKERDECSTFVHGAMSYARKEQVEVVVVTSRFPLYLRGTPYNNGEGGLEKRDPVYFDLIETKAGTGDDRQRQNRVENGFEERIRSLASEFKVVLVYPIPEAGWDVPITASRNAWFSGREPQLSTDFGAYKKRTAEVNALFDRLTVELPNVYGARVYQALCSEKTARCVNADENGIYYHDDDHLSKSGARRVAPIMVDAVEKALQQGEESRMADQRGSSIFSVTKGSPHDPLIDRYARFQFVRCTKSCLAVCNGENETVRVGRDADVLVLKRKDFRLEIKCLRHVRRRGRAIR